MGPLHLSVQSRGSGLDIGVPHSKIFDMPMEMSLKFVPVVGTDRMNPERELFHDVIDEADGATLIVAGINFSARIRVASSMAVYWNRLIVFPAGPMNFRNLMSIWT